MAQIKFARWGAFYKYGTFQKIERLKPMIFEGRLYFASPSQLNDPSDCKNVVHNHSEKEIEEFLIQAHRKFYGDARNDSYISKEIKKFGAETLLEEIANKINEIMDKRYGVFSLSRRPDNMALWAKYADNHKGYCLEFSQFANVYEIRYAQKLPLSLKLEINPRQADFLYTKSSEWSNEEEARILAKPSGYHSSPKGALKSIILGEHCKTENQNTIQNWAKENKVNISIKKANFNTTKQELEFLTI